MAKTVIFLIHGIGIHGPDWVDAPIDVLVKAGNAYSGFSETAPITDCIEFVNVRYDDIFDEILGQWNNLSDGLTGMPGATPKIIQEIAGKLNSYSDPGDNAFASHGMDIIFYDQFALVRRLVQLTVISKIMQTVVEKGHDRKYCVIAHSQGTTVAHDAIHRMASTRWLKQNMRLSKPVLARMKVLNLNESDLQKITDHYAGNPFGPSSWGFEAIFMIANTSKLLHKDTPPPSRSLVCPPTVLPSRDYMCHRFYNIAHAFDPVCFLNEFDVSKLWKKAVSRCLAYQINVNHIYDVNVHGLSHYLVHPDVHRHIFRSSVGDRFTEEDFKYAKTRTSKEGDFPKFGPNFTDEDKHEAIMDKLLWIIDSDGARQTADGMVERLIALKAVIDEFLDL